MWYTNLSPGRYVVHEEGRWSPLRCTPYSWVGWHRMGCGKGDWPFETDCKKMRTTGARGICQLWPRLHDNRLAGLHKRNRLELKVLEEFQVVIWNWSVMCEFPPQSSPRMHRPYRGRKQGTCPKDTTRQYTKILTRNLRNRKSKPRPEEPEALLK